MTFTSNQLWYGIDYSQYDKPTVIRRHGLKFLEKFWNPRHDVKLRTRGVR
jgi:hypothetical protein